jgi:hypothetical protein
MRRRATVLTVLILLTVLTAGGVAQAQGAAQGGSCEATVVFVYPGGLSDQGHLQGDWRMGVGVPTPDGMVVIPSDQNGVVRVLLPDGQPTAFAMVPMYLIDPRYPFHHGSDYFPADLTLHCGIQPVMTFTGA